MMKKRHGAVVVVLLIAAVWLLGNKGLAGRSPVAVIDQGPTVEATAAVLLDAKTGEWLYRSNEKQALPPASMSKMMTEVLVLEAVRKGKINWQDGVSPSAYAARVGGATMGLSEGRIVTVKALFEAMAIHSANDAAVALAEYVSGTEADFVARMNDKARKIGLSKDTIFANATGLPSADLQAYEAASAEGETVMTAEDAALLARYLVETYPQVLKVTKRQSAGDSAEEALTATNEMLPGGRFGTAGNEGLKTGYTEKAGYCFTGSTVIEGKRYITVVMGAATAESRFTETQKLLAYAKKEASE